jgi:hypothetical protein
MLIPPGPIRVLVATKPVAQLAALIEGLDWMRVRARRVLAPEAVQ